MIAKLKFNKDMAELILHALERQSFDMPTMEIGRHTELNKRAVMRYLTALASKEVVIYFSQAHQRSIGSGEEIICRLR